MSEAELQKAVALYLRMEYPDVIFHSDFGSGVKLSIYQAKMQKMQNGGKRAWPDMFIAQKSTIIVKAKNGGLKQMFYGGMFIELKKEGVRLKKKNGEWASDHIKEQAELLEDLRKRGYAATFAIGFDEATNKIDEYLGGNNAKTKERH